ncbi:hypothetical protein POF50_004300 [Streptomyces sp. SL13]|uniref:Uncharacterized protein n=1 Tax=Streptantibioticus silvisoli TaxID=2705255 RepID=A0AA90H110_9ACTN|nr:hypothetical protein [Streptantibioticus silvisoli]MDI5968575.1 hypothetical protein [Streptantibioticus silvisoli]
MDLTPFSRSLPSLHQLTPDYACVESPGGLRHPRELTSALDGVDPGLLADAGRFHEEIRTAARNRVRQGGSDRLCLPVVGVRQPTPTTPAKGRVHARDVASFVGSRQRQQRSADASASSRSAVRFPKPEMEFLMPAEARRVGRCADGVG